MAPGLSELLDIDNKACKNKLLKGDLGAVAGIECSIAIVPSSWAACFLKLHLIRGDLLS
jgi:hypothetical protein